MASMLERGHDDPKTGEAAVERAAAARHRRYRASCDDERGIAVVHVDDAATSSPRWRSWPTCCSTRRSRPRRSSASARRNSWRSSRRSHGRRRSPRASSRWCSTATSIRTARRRRTPRSRPSRATISSPLHKQYFRPGHALITVVGDVSSAGAKAIVERDSRHGASRARRSTFDYPALPPPQKTTIYLVDKPGAAQSTFAIGLPGPPRSTPDYYAIQVMNMIARRVLPVAAEHEPARGEGLQLRRALVVRFRQGAWRVRGRRRHRVGEDRRGARRIHEGAEGHRRARGRSPTRS